MFTRPNVVSKTLRLLYCESCYKLSGGWHSAASFLFSTLFTVIKRTTCLIPLVNDMFDNKHTIYCTALSHLSFVFSRCSDGLCPNLWSESFKVHVFCFLKDLLKVLASKGHDAHQPARV